MNKELGQKIKEARKLADVRQEDVADKLKLARTTYARKESDGDFTTEELKQIKKILSLTDDDLSQVTVTGESYAQYLKRTGNVKVVDGMQLLVHDMMQVKAMNRVMLRTLAELMAKQTDRSVTSVLAELSKAVREETSEGFDAL